MPRSARATTPPSCDSGWRPRPCAPMATRSYWRPEVPTRRAALSSSSATSRPLSPTRTSLRTLAPPSYPAARLGSNPISPGSRLAGVGQLVQEAIGDELEALLDQLVVNLALPLDLFGGLELGGEPGFELAKPHIVKACGVDVVSGNAAAGHAAQLDGTIHSPIGMLGVVHWHEHFTVHGSAFLVGDASPREPNRWGTW